MRQPTKKKRSQVFGNGFKNLQIGDIIRVQPLKPNSRQREKAKVTKQVPGRSYKVETSQGKAYRRNRHFLWQTAPCTPSFINGRPVTDSQTFRDEVPTIPREASDPETEVTAGRPETVTNWVCTRSGRDTFGSQYYTEVNKQRISCPGWNTLEFYKRIYSFFLFSSFRFSMICMFPKVKQEKYWTNKKIRGGRCWV